MNRERPSEVRETELPDGPLMVYASLTLVASEDLENGRMDAYGTDGRHFVGTPRPAAHRMTTVGKHEGMEVRLIRHYEPEFGPWPFLAAWKRNGLVKVDRAREPLRHDEFMPIAARSDERGEAICHMLEPPLVQAVKVHAAGQWHRHGADVLAMMRHLDPGATFDPASFDSTERDIADDWSEAFRDVATAAPAMGR